MNRYIFGLHDLKIEFLGYNGMYNLYEFLNNSYNIINWQKLNKTETFNLLQMKRYPEPFEHKSWSFKVKWKNVTQWISDVLNCYYCPLYYLT